MSTTHRVAPSQGYSTARRASPSRKALGCRHKSRAETLETIQMELRMAIATDNAPRTPCPCCGGGVAVGGVDWCVVCFQVEREQRRAKARGSSQV